MHHKGTKDTKINKGYLSVSDYLEIHCEKTKLLSVGDKVHPGKYQTHSRFEHVVNFTNGEHLLSLVQKVVGAGPLNIVVEGGNLHGIRVIEIENHSVLLGDRRYDFDVDQVFHSGMDFGPVNIAIFRKNLSIFEKLIIQTSHPKSLAFVLDERRVKAFESGFERAFVKRITDGVQQIYDRDIISGVKMLQGCGFGLTPSGDDFIAGLLVGLNFIQKMFGSNLSALIAAVYEASIDSNIFSNAFLYLAKEGLLFEKLKKLILALIHGGEKEVYECTGSLFSVGGTSGADLATGFFMTVEAELRSLQLVREPVR
jgi:hypothetical protein